MLFSLKELCNSKHVGKKIIQTVQTPTKPIRRRKAYLKTLKQVLNTRSKPTPRI
jgi:hypothetical protein